MHRVRHSIASILLILLIPGSAGLGGDAPNDPYDEVVEALAQGRHWYAKRLLSRIERRTAKEPVMVLLAARADAGRGAWSQVVRRLNGAGWLDSLDFGDGRFLAARAWLEVDRYDRALEQYDEFLSYSIERTPRALAEIGRARALAGLGHTGQAADAYGNAMSLLPDLAPWLAVRVAESLAGSGDTAAVRRHLKDAGAIPLWRRARARAEAHYAAGDRDRAATLFLRAANDTRERARAAELRTQAVRILLEDADTAAATRVARTAVRLGSGSARAAADLLVLMPGLRATDHLYLARVYERSGHRTHAVTQYREYMARARLSRAERRRLRMKMGELLFRARWYTAAIDELEALQSTQCACASAQ